MDEDFYGTSRGVLWVSWDSVAVHVRRDLIGKDWNVMIYSSRIHLTNWPARCQQPRLVFYRCKSFLINRGPINHGITFVSNESQRRKRSQRQLPSSSSPSSSSSSPFHSFILWWLFFFFFFFWAFSPSVFLFQRFYGWLILLSLNQRADAVFPYRHFIHQPFIYFASVCRARGIRISITRGVRVWIRGWMRSTLKRSVE